MSDDGKLTSHSALIAGAGGGIGLETAKLLAAEGCHLNLADLNDFALEKAADEIAGQYDREPEIYSTDLSESVNAAVLALECEDVSILINCFGTVPTGNIDTLDADDWTAGFELRVFGAINLCREVLEGMFEVGSGIIINVGCMVDDDDEDQLCPQSANATLVGFAEKLDKQTKRQGIRVLTFLPKAGESASEHATALTRMIFGKLSS